MQAVSREYKAHMQGIYRNHTYMHVSIGLINHEAQSSAKVSEPERYTYYSNLSMPFNGYAVEELYASCDEDYTKTDGSMFFLPRLREAVVLNQGLVTEEIKGVIEIRFPVQHDIKGLTIDFGSCYPLEFTIESNNTAVSVSGNPEGRYITEEAFGAADFIRITPVRMKNGESRLRIHQITFGIGLYFDSNRIISASKREHISPIMESIPNLDFDLTVNNTGRLFDVENDQSSINYLRIGQKISIMYGQELDSGEVEWQQGATAYLRRWSADDDRMNFVASDRFDDMDKVYYRGQYRPDGISLHDLAIDVLTDAGIDQREYRVDDCLRRVKVKNPMPPVSHKQALQLIANAGRCQLGQDRHGGIYLQASFLPDFYATSETATYYSKTQDITKQPGKVSYAGTGQDYTDVAPTQYFLPRKKLIMPSTDLLATGYISDLAADASGNFPANAMPNVWILFESLYKIFGMSLQFGRNYPPEVILQVYSSNDLIEEYVAEVTDARLVIVREFPEFNRLRLRFPKGRPNNRIELLSVEFGRSTDYWLRYGTELLKTPLGMHLEQVKELSIVRSIYTRSAELKEVGKATVSIPSRHTFYFSSPVYDLDCILRNPGGFAAATIVDSSNYYATVEVTSGTGEMELVIMGREYQLVESRYTKPLNPTGKVEEWNNPLVSDPEHAGALADWIGNYLKADREYDITYRGDPRIDANDILYLENKYVPELLLRVYDHTLRFNGALSGTIKARRDVGYVADP